MCYKIFSCHVECCEKIFVSFFFSHTLLLIKFSFDFRYLSPVPSMANVFQMYVERHILPDSQMELSNGTSFGFDSAGRIRRNKAAGDYEDGIENRTFLIKLMRIFLASHAELQSGFRPTSEEYLSPFRASESLPSRLSTL